MLVLERSEGREGKREGQRGENEPGSIYRTRTGSGHGRAANGARIPPRLHRAGPHSAGAAAPGAGRGGAGDFRRGRKPAGAGIRTGRRTSRHAKSGRGFLGDQPLAPGFRSALGGRTRSRGDEGRVRLHRTYPACAGGKHADPAAAQSRKGRACSRRSPPSAATSASLPRTRKAPIPRSKSTGAISPPWRARASSIR